MKRCLLAGLRQCVHPASQLCLHGRSYLLGITPNHTSKGPSMGMTSLPFCPTPPGELQQLLDSILRVQTIGHGIPLHCYDA